LCQITINLHDPRPTKPTNCKIAPKKYQQDGPVKKLSLIGGLPHTVNSTKPISSKVGLPSLISNREGQLWMLLIASYDDRQL
jgi:hypothetical protein